jgi:U5 small nuclear ribonucleoprotein component
VKFKILDAALDPAPIHRGGGQVIPASRRLVYSSYLVATPRLMEPVYSIEIQTTTEMAEAAHTVLNRRRGHVVKETAVPGAPFSVLQAYIPVIESFGFQVDLRTYTQGQVFAQLDFDHWAVAPGDPMDSDVILHPLEPSPPAALSRDFMLKTRRRKGLPEDVSFARFFDDAMLLKLNEEADET